MTDLHRGCLLYALLIMSYWKYIVVTFFFALVGGGGGGGGAIIVAKMNHIPGYVYILNQMTVHRI